MHCNQEVRAQKHVEIIELRIFPGLHEVFEHDENMVLILFQFCPLRAVPAVFDSSGCKPKRLASSSRSGDAGSATSNHASSGKSCRVAFVMRPAYIRTSRAVTIEARLDPALFFEPIIR